MHCFPTQRLGSRSRKQEDFFESRPFGVNVIGHALDVFGLGESLRLIVKALQVSKIPCCVLNVPAGNTSRQDLSLQHLLTAGELPYAFNLICLAPPSHLQWLMQTGAQGSQGHFNIAYWFWETNQWPKNWEPLVKMVDEAWAPSALIEQALRPLKSSHFSIQRMPMAAEIVQPAVFCEGRVRRRTRLVHGLPCNAFLFGYGFDFNSTASRKNPMGVLEAFQMAFPLDQQLAGRFQVALMIKTFPLRCRSSAWEALLSRAGADPRIHLIAESLSREDLLALYGCCDAFVSLHRSEGFGLGMAEALQMGVDVIATDFGGNTDFCQGPLAHPVRFRRKQIPPGSYPYADGHVWAEPDLEHAAELMQWVVATKRWPLRETSEALIQPYRDLFSFKRAGDRFRERLETLWAQRDEASRRVAHRDKSSFDSKAIA